MATSVFGEVLDMEEQLFGGVANGPLENYKDLLNSLGDVDMQGVKQRTLLHIAVRLGKVDWVEGLLGKGANPGLRDVDGESIMELAQGMVEKYPEDGDRKQISKLVYLVNIGRDSAVSVALGGCNNTPECLDIRMEAIQQEMSVLSRGMASIRESMNDIRSQMTTNNTKMREVANIRKSIDVIITGMAKRDILLTTLECSVTSLANKERLLAGTSATLVVTGEGVPSVPRTEEDIRKECVEAMVRKTLILRSDDGKVTKARGLFEKVYAAGDETACLLKFMKRQENVCIEIDFNSCHIGRMKSKVRDHDGVEREGSRFTSFANFEERKVYLGGGNEDEDVIIGFLARALAQLALFLAFGNEGRPYARGNDVTGQQMKSVVKESEAEGRRKGGELDVFIHYALAMKTRLGKEIYLASAVPTIIATLGFSDGTSYLQQKVPSLLRFFRESMMPALLAKAQQYI